jgi:hypothetical protein
LDGFVSGFFGAGVCLLFFFCLARYFGGFFFSCFATALLFGGLTKALLLSSLFFSRFAKAFGRRGGHALLVSAYALTLAFFFCRELLAEGFLVLLLSLFEIGCFGAVSISLLVFLGKLLYFLSLCSSLVMSSLTSAFVSILVFALPCTLLFLFLPLLFFSRNLLFPCALFFFPRALLLCLPCALFFPSALLLLFPCALFP